MGRTRKQYIPPVSKFNYPKIFSRCIIGTFFVTVTCVIVAHLLHTPIEPPQEKLVVDGFNCKIPDLVNVTLREDIPPKKRKYFPCYPQALLTSVVSTGNLEESVHLKFLPENLAKYDISGTVDCCYHIVHRKADNDFENYMSSKCIPFVMEQELNRSIDFVLVKCKKGKKEIYSMMHAIVLIKEHFKTRFIASKLNKEEAYRVVLFGFDSMSRVNFKRGMKDMHATISKTPNWFELEGFTRLSNKTYHNIFAILTGQSPFEKHKDCDPTSNTHLDGCQFIWKFYQKSGYVTAYGEDQLNFGTFNRYHKGFRKSPTDHYFRPFVVTAEKEIKGLRRYEDVAFCLGKSVYSDHLIIYTVKVMVMHEDDPYFGYFYSNSLSERKLSIFRNLDARIGSFAVPNIEALAEDNTIVIFFGDKGMRLEHSAEGFYEERSPMLWIRLPPSLQKKHPEILQNVLLNKNRMTSPYDLHITLRHILKLSSNNVLPLKAEGCSECKSLFEEIPISRSCSDINIPADSCPCSLESLDLPKEVAEQAAQHAVDLINRKLASSGKSCEILRLSTVMSAKQQMTSYSNVNFIVLFNVTPSEALYEAIMIRTFPSIVTIEPQFKLIQEIIHLNKHANPIECVSKPSLSKRMNEEDLEAYSNDYYD